MATIFFGSNVKFLRTRKNLTQAELAGKLSVTRSKVNSIEMGQIKSPSLPDLISFSEFYQISVDSLLKIDLSKIGELNLRELEAGNDIYIKGGNLRVLAITVDKSNRENIEDVPVNAQAGYIEGYSNSEFIAALPKFHLPDIPEKGTFRRFPISGDSMLIEEGSKVIGEYVANWEELRPGTPCIVVLKTTKPLFKLVTARPESRDFLLESLNPEHAPFTVDAGHISEFWKFHSYSSSKLPEPQSDLRALTKVVLAMKDDLATLKNTKR